MPEAEQKGYDTFEHTADVGLEVWAPTVEALFQQAGEGFVALMLDPRTVQADHRMEVRAEGQGREELLVAWLEEVLYVFEAEGFAPATVRVEELTEGRVRGTLEGEPFDPERHQTRTAVKAVTYHDLQIEQTEDRYRVRIVFDV